MIDAPKPVAARFQVAWAFEGGGDCVDVGAEVVRLNMVFSEGQLTDEFPCEDLIGVTHAVETGVSYSLQLVAFDGDGVEIGRSDARTESVVGDGQTAELSPFVIALAGG